MVPVIEGIIARRILVNFRAVPEVVRKIVPQPLEIRTVNNHAIVGICLIRLEQIRPKGLPAFVGMASENMAHRFAIRYESEAGWADGVYIPRRDTDSTFVHLLGGRLFPGYHHHAAFGVNEGPEGLVMDIRTKNQEADVSFNARWSKHWPGSEVFSDLADSSEFFRRGSCGFSCGRDGKSLDGLRLQTLEWRVEPLDVVTATSAYFSDRKRFPEGSVVFDHALLMRGMPHEWHELRHVPELVGDFANT